MIPPTINPNIETLLFGYEMFAPFKEWKAAFHLKLFGKPVSPQVSVSNDRTFLFYAETIDSSTNTSSFKFLSDSEIQSLVDTINAVREYYLKMGFDDVILSIAPNPVSIIPAGETLPYNQLIPRIQNHPDLKIKCVDVYSPFIAHPSPRELYWRNDTHWNSNGFRIWVDEMNKLLRTVKK